MKQIIPIVFVLVVLIGCATPDITLPILEGYKTVDFSDQISEAEAIVIAQKRVIDVGFTKDFVLEDPRVVKNFDNVPHSDQYWFVSFREIEGSFLRSVFMIIIEKETGKIVFSRSYLPKNEWIIEAAIRKLYEKR